MVETVKETGKLQMIKGVILAGGTGSRLYPLTRVSNKHLLPVYDKPMIFYPIQTLVNAGIKEILIVSGAEYSNHFFRLLGKGNEFGASFSYAVQKEARGIADALKLAKNFSKGEKIVAILGDNIFEDSFKKHVKEFVGDKNDSARIFLKKVPNANRFGVAKLGKNGVVEIKEKPKEPKTGYAVTGIYFYPPSVFRVIGKLMPSKRGEFEITDVNNYYVKTGKMKAVKLSGFWSDAGTFESLFRASEFVKRKKL